MLLLLPATISGCGAASNGTSTSGVPSWIPKSTVAVGRIVTASAAHPAVAVEGDTVAVQVPGAAARVTVVGPQVPVSGVAPIPTRSAVMFQVTLSGVSGITPISAADFSVVDELGALTHPRLVASVGPITNVGPIPTAVGSVPSNVTRNEAVTFDFTDTIAVGNGVLQWAPVGNGRTLVEWDFAVEVD
jgi:hypothetical protein